MHKMPRLKKTFFFTLSFFITLGVKAQSFNSEANIYKNFADLSGQDSAQFFICKAPISQLHTFEKEGRLVIKRQLADSLFIILTKGADLSKNNQLQLRPANFKWKFSPDVLNSINVNNQKFPSSFLIAVNNSNDFEQWLKAYPLYFEKIGKNNFIIKISNETIFNSIAALHDVNFISYYNTSPRPELQINSLDLSANSISLLHNLLPTLNGDSLVVSIKENSPDTSDIDLRGRYILNPLASANISPHTNIMATMIAGAGNSWYLGRGVAKMATITSSDFSKLLPDPDANYQQYKISVQNHSYGVGVENFYGADAAAFDQTALDNDKLLLVFSAGNSGAATPTVGIYAGIAGVANLTGSFKMAKNIITVGAIDSFNTVVSPSSKGPAYDGRVKPEMVAYGEDGSSGAAALVSGTALLLQQAYKNKNAGLLPSSSLIKAALLNSCDDIGMPEIDFASGYGSLNAYKAVQEINAHQYFTGVVANAATQNFLMNIPANISKAKITLVWNDAPANANAYTALVNDLDLTVKNNATGTIWQPWVLNSFANKDSLTLLPLRKRDSLNNIEQVTIDNPAAGNYTISVKGYNVPQGPQNFSITYQLDTANNFYWKYPTASDNIFTNTANLVRWGNSFATGNGLLEYSIDKGNSWIKIAQNVNPATGYASWIAPDTVSLGMLKMTIGARQFVSDTFTICPKPDIKVGFNCTDSVLLYWDKIKAINQYQLYYLGDKFLQPLTLLSDTQFVFSKNNLPAKEFAIAPVLQAKNAVKSYTIQYETQGVDCYISTLLADLVNEHSAKLQLTLGTSYLVQKIVFQKLSNNIFQSLKEFTNINSLQFSVTDDALSKGQNIYRVALYLSNGNIIYSEIEKVLYFKNDEVIIYPNPVNSGAAITIELKELNNQIITLFDIAGRRVLQKTATDKEFILPAYFVKGLYILTVYDPVMKSKNVCKVIIR